MLAGVTSEGEEDAEESSSSSLYNMQNHFKSALDEFRENWEKELKTETRSGGTSHTDHLEAIKAEENEENAKAERFFQQAVELEKRGKVYDALQFYRKAVQIEPDIEFRMYEVTKAQQAAAIQQGKEEESKAANDGIKEAREAEVEEDLTDVNLFNRFQAELLQKGGFIASTVDSGVLNTQLHISDLPMEIILYILRWVVSSQLDMRSLEQCASSCKGLYLCARDEEIWRQACLKVWGVNTGLLSKSSYLSWRQMFIERERIHFNGCYISKTTYLRYGENSFQDEFYRPVQLVEYYRYFRFLPDGTAYMMTTSEEPSIGVTKLKNLGQLRSDVLRGHYRLHGDLVIVMLKKPQPKPIQSMYKRRGSVADFDANLNTFYIELSIVSTSKRKFCQLHWKHYSSIQIRNKKETTNYFELSGSKFPPLWFSRVKSYHLEAEAPLQ